MSDTIGSLVDKLATVNNKMFFNQEFLYELRRMSVEDFLNEYDNDRNENAAPNLIDLYYKLKKVVDLNLQRQALILEHDKMLVELVLDLIEDKSRKDKYVVDQHKTLKEG